MTTINKENVDPSPSLSDKGKHPSKSILKDNTLPIPSNKRRVSFAPEVTLHKFDFVPYGTASDPKRRKTIGELPGSDSDVSANDSLFFEKSDEEPNEAEGQGKQDEEVGLEILDDSSDSDEDISFSKIESQVDTVLRGLDIFNGDGSHDVERPVFAGDDEEQTMELTGQISSIPDLGFKKPMHAHINNHHFQEQLPERQSVVDNDNSSDDSGEEIDMELTGTQKVVHTTDIPSSSLAQTEEVADQEAVMDLTNIPTNFHDEVSMEITKVWSITKITENSIHNEMDYEEKSKAAVEGSTNEIATETGPRDAEINTKLESLAITSADVEEENSENLLQDDGEQTMELTQAVGQIISRESSEENPEFEETMDFTQVTSVIFNGDRKNTSSDNNLFKASDENTGSSGTIAEAAAVEMKPLNITSQNSPEKPQEIQTEIAQSQELGSQPMQLTQESHGSFQVATESEVAKAIENPSYDIAESTIEREGINDELVTTTKVPLTDLGDVNEVSEVSVGEDDDEDAGYIPVTLGDFMRDVGVKFYDDLDIDIYLTKRFSITTASIEDKSSYEIKDYMKAFSKLELFSLYQFTCEELNKNISEGKLVFAEFNKTIESNNPSLFKEYYSCNPQERLALSVRLQLMKDYTRHESKITWYDWRTQLTTNLIQELEIKHRGLLEDKARFIHDLKVMDEVYSSAKTKLENLKGKLKNVLRLQGQLNGLDPEKLLGMKNKLQGLSTDLSNLRQSVKSKRDQLAQLNDSIQSNNSLKVDLSSELRSVESTISSNRRYELEEVKMLSLKFRLLQSIANLRLAKSESSGLNFVFDEIILIKFVLEEELKMVISLLPNSPSAGKFYNQWLLQEYALKASEVFNSQFGKTSIIDRLKNFKEFWVGFKKLDLDIYKLSLKYPFTRIDSNDVIKFQIKYFNFRSEYKVGIIFEIKLNQVLNYESEARLEGNLIRAKGKIGIESIRNDILNDLSVMKLANEKNISEMLISGVQ